MKGLEEMATLGDIARNGARTYPDAEAVVFENTRLTYREFDKRTNRLANALAKFGTTKGDRVAILAENTHKYLEVYVGVAKAGLVTTPLNFRLSRDELAHILNESEASVVLVGEDCEATALGLLNEVKGVCTWVGLDSKFGGHFYEDLLAGSSDVDPLVAVGENELAVLMYTGGTTGTPKGVMLSHRNVMTAAIATCLQAGLTKDDATCFVLPIFHVSWWPIISLLLVGGKVVIVRRPDLVEMLRLIEEERCTHLNLVPTLYAALINQAPIGEYDLSSLRLLTYAGSPFPLEVLKQAISVFGPRFVQGYGATETAGGPITMLAAEDHHLEGPDTALLGSAGKSAICSEVKVVDEHDQPVGPGEIGEVCVRGEHVMLGYWRNPELTSRALRGGWYHTGDLGYLDGRGYLFLTDRKSDMIITGGENVYPSEVENVLYTHPAVLECSVVATPDDRWVEIVHAVVVLRDGAQVTAEEIIEHCHGSLAGYKCPKKVTFVPALPKTAVGKISRKTIKEMTI